MTTEGGTAVGTSRASAAPAPTHVDDAPITAIAWKALLIAGISQLVPALNLSLMYVVYPELQKDFPNVSVGALSWVLNGYTILASATLVLGGVLSDRTGRKRALLVGTALVLAAQIVCGSAPNVPTLIVGRLLIACGASLVIPASTALALREFPGRHRALAFGALASFGGIAAAAGPSFGAWVIDQGGWRMAFWVCTPVLALILLLGPFMLRESRDESARALPDPIGAIMLMFGLASTILGLVQSPTWGWGDRRTISALVVGGVVLTAMVVRSAGHSAPFLDVRLFRFRNFALMNLVSVLISVAWYGMFFLLTQFLRNTWHLGLTEAGLLVSPVPLGAGVLGPIGGRLADRVGYRPMLLAGSGSFVLGAAWFLVMLGDHRNLAHWLPGITLIGIGTGFIFPSVQGGTVIGMPPHQYAIASGINQTVQRVGSAVGNALGVVFLASVGPSGALHRIFFVLLAASVLMLPLSFAVRVSDAADAG